MRCTDQQPQTWAAYSKQQGCSGHRSGELEGERPGSTRHCFLQERVPSPAQPAASPLLRTRPKDSAGGPSWDHSGPRRSDVNGGRNTRRL